MIVPVSEQMQEPSDSLDPLLLIAYREVVVEASRPLLERTVPPLDVVF